MKWILLLALTITNAFSGIEQAPPNFQIKDGKAVFVDFLKMHVSLDYDYQKKEAWAQTTIYFYAPEQGLPIFDSVNTPLFSTLNGEYVEHGYTAVPDNVSFVRYINKEVEAGFHTMRINTKVTEGLLFDKKGVSNGFFIKDLTDRKFFERFIVANYEYDQYKMTFDVQITGTEKAHNVFANAKVTELSKNRIKVEYPDFYTASSAYFHLVPKTKFYRKHFKYKSINGNVFPVTIYSKFKFRNWVFKRKTKRILRELERDYGPWPHPSLLIYGTKLKGGMEYVGATATSYRSLDHELQHSYFAKGILPANGNSGWMDEGIASWRDRGHKKHKRPKYHSFNLGNQSVYTRKTDKNSYKKGRTFFAYINYKLKKAGFRKGLKGFLREYFEKRKFTTVTTQMMISDLQEYSGIDFTKDFDRYVFGKYKNSKGRSPAVEPRNPHHRDYTEKEIRSIL